MHRSTKLACGKAMRRILRHFFDYNPIQKFYGIVLVKRSSANKFMVFSHRHPQWLIRNCLGKLGY